MCVCVRGPPTPAVACLATILAPAGALLEGGGLFLQQLSGRSSRVSTTVSDVKASQAVAVQPSTSWEQTPVESSAAEAVAENLNQSARPSARPVWRTGPTLSTSVWLERQPPACAAARQLSEASAMDFSKWQDYPTWQDLSDWWTWLDRSKCQD